MSENSTPCAKCGDRNPDWDRDWSKSDKEWKEVVPEEWRDKTLCPWCFVRFAIEMNIHYEPVYRDGIIVELNRIPAPEET